jgi:hypothetical protein
MAEELSMSSGKAGPDPPLVHPTRQMLDELDALMERMLALPIGDVEPAAPPDGGPPNARHTPTLAAKLTLLPAPSDEPPLDAPHSGTNPSHLPTVAIIRSATAGLPPSLETAAPTPEPLASHVVPPPMVPSADALRTEVPEPPATLAGWLILPLLWGNRLFDLGTVLLGEPGSWLRSPGGRGVLGVAGLLLLAAACVWLMRDWLGWTW